MKLHRYYEQLLARSDELADQEREQLLAHLGTCERCRREQRALRAQDEWLRRFAGAQPLVSLEAGVLADIRSTQGRELEPARARTSRVKLVPAVGGLALAASLLLAVGVTLGQHLEPRAGTPTAVAARQSCTVAGASWELKGPCQIVSSPTALRSSGVTYYPLALRWAKQHIRNPKYIIRRNDRLPVLIRHSGSAVYFSEVAKDQGSHRSVYVVGEEE